MEHLLALLKPHASWLFGSGGVAAAALSYLKFFRGVKDARSADTKGEIPQTVRTSIGDASAGGDIVGGDKTIDSGLGGLEVALIVALVVCLGGLGLMFAGDDINASDGSVVIKGSGNTTNVKTTTPSE